MKFANLHLKDYPVGIVDHYNGVPQGPISENTKFIISINLKQG